MRDVSRNATTTLSISISRNRRNNVRSANATITRPTATPILCQPFLSLKGPREGPDPLSHGPPLNHSAPTGDSEAHSPIRLQQYCYKPRISA